MKLICLLLVCLLTFTIIVPSSCTFRSGYKHKHRRSHLRNVKNIAEGPAPNNSTSQVAGKNVSGPPFVLPDSMKHIGSPAQTLTFPDPRHLAYLLFSFFYDNDTFGCSVGNDTGLSIRKLVMNFMGQYKPPNQTTIDEAKKNIKKQEATFNSILENLDKVYESNCSAYLQAESRRFRRSLFLIALR